MQSLTKYFQSSIRTASSSSYPSVSVSTARNIHIEPGAREKALLEEDPALKKFKSYKNSIRRMHVARDILTIVVVSACCYEIMYTTMMKKAERDQRLQKEGSI
eukprot:TRINITY_DN2342_c0_g1_i1.p1 TRINITY_DN2342_c0_g1~~TRINITY_DN2342_c0_g1_i1.p1  ORF type:complete len:103 (+),score=9.26 TRINITY_DN2342_c0_g1_i1:119-427(+)